MVPPLPAHDACRDRNQRASRRQADVYQFDIDENNSLADSQGVSTIPTFILYSNGKEVWRHSGEIDGQALLSKIRAQM